MAPWLLGDGEICSLALRLGGGGRGAHLLPLAWGSYPVLSHPPVPKVAEVPPAAELAPFGALVLAHTHQGAGLPACRELGQVEGHGNRPQ